MGAFRDLAAMMDLMARAGDLAWGAFPDDAPWVLDRGAIPWWADAERLREQVRREVPALITPGRLPPGGRGVAVVARLGVAVVPWVWRRRRGKAPGAKGVAELSRRLRLAAETLGPTFIKLGQIISSGEGIFPPELVGEFKRCRDQVPAESFDDVRRTVEEDLGRRLDEVFASFEEAPLAAASIAQVHVARLAQRRGGRRQGAAPDVARAIQRDVRAMAWLAPHLVGRIPRGVARQPAGAGRAVRRHDRRGARLPRRGRQHARRGGDAARPRHRRATSCRGRTRRSSPGGSS